MVCIRLLASVLILACVQSVVDEPLSKVRMLNSRHCRMNILMQLTKLSEIFSIHCTKCNFSVIRCDVTNMGCNVMITSQLT